MDRRTRKYFVAACFLATHLLFFSAPFTKCLTTEELFLRGNLLYEKNDLEEALRTYSQVKYAGPVILYNIGNCHFKKNDYAHAVVYWMRAKDGADKLLLKSIDNNINIVNTILNKTTERSMYNKGLEFTDLVLYEHSLLLWQAIFLVLWICLILTVFCFSRRRKNVLFFVLVLLCSFFGALLYRKYVLQNMVVAVVRDDKTSVYAITDSKGAVRGKVSLVDCVEIKKQEKGWYKINYDSLGGWIEEKNIIIV